MKKGYTEEHEVDKDREMLNDKFNSQERPLKNKFENIKYLILNQGRPDGEDYSNKDFSTDFHFDNSLELKLDSDDLKEKINAIKDNRVIAIYCSAPLLLSSINTSFIRALSGEEKFDLRAISFKGTNTDSQLKLQHIQKNCLDGNIPRIFHVDLVNTPSCKGFLNDLFEQSSAGSHVKGSLLGTNTYIICTFSDPELKQLFTLKKDAFYFSQWDVDVEKYILPILKTKFSNREAKDIFENLQKHKEFGFYGNNQEEINYGIFKLLYEEGNEILKEVYRNAEKYKIAIEKGEKRISRISVKDLLKKTPIAKELLYVACFFPNLHLREFARIVKFILDGKECLEEVEEQFITKKGKKKLIKKQVKVSSLDYFERDPDLSFQKVNLHEIIGEESTTVIDFNKAYLRKDIRTYYQSNYPTYCIQQFYDIIRYNFLFDEEASYSLVKNIIKLVVEIALSDPQYYGRELLVYAILKIEKSDVKQESDQKDSNQKKLNEEELEKAKIVAALSAFLNKQHKLDRLALLIATFIEHNSLSKVVDDFLESLIKIWKTPEILLSILERLKYDTNIDHLFWLKRIFDEVPDEGVDKKTDVKKDANTFFIALGEKSNTEIFNLLNEVKAWWVDKDENSGQHFVYGLAFLYNYSRSSLYQLPYESYGKFPSKYFLFAGLNDLDLQGVKEKIAFFIEWLFHPSLQGLSYNHNYKFDLFEVKTNADLIEHWALVLFGQTKRKKAEPKAKRLFKMILKQVKKSTNRATQRSLRAIWSQKSQYYLELATTLSFQETAKRKVLMYRRDNLKKIIKYFGNQ